MNIAYDIVRGVFLKNWEKLTDEEKAEVKQKSEILLDYDDQVEKNKKELRKLEEKKKGLDSLIQEKEEAVKIFDQTLSDTRKKILVTENVLQNTEVVREVREEEKRKTTSELIGEQRKLESLRSKVHTVAIENNSLEEEIEKKKKELEELNEIVSILKSTNQNGLDIVASFEGERNRLLGKEATLLRKERDLGIYERRLKQQYKTIGKDMTMVFE